MFYSINPYTGEKFLEHQELSSKQVNDILERAHQQYLSWKKLSYQQRGKLFLNLAQLLCKNKEAFARLITLEMGKIISESRAEAEKCAWLCDYYAENTEALLQTKQYATDAGKSYVRFDPTGIVYGIMPWNFPFWQVLRAAVPTVMAGNTFVLKHAPNVLGSAQAIEQLFIEAGFPEHVFSSLTIPVSLSEQVIAHPFVEGVTLTGSLRAGATVAAQAGKYLKKSVMELGGSDPYLVLKDAEINSSCKTGVCSRMLNGGQVCISAKRFIVEEPVLDQFIEEQKRLLEAMTLGDPLDEQTDMGPMAREDLLEQIEKQVNDSVAMGAKVLTGGQRTNDGKWFYQPTLLVNVKKGMPVFDEETFGPVSVVIPAKDAQEAVRIANDTPYGLGASLWTQDLELAAKLAAQIESGAVFINEMTKSDPRLPFGGTKRSGYGRELSDLGIREFLNAKTVWQA
ncbi:MAG: NAD-dependent succinate-semialdehyde dehydrogenase [Bacteroidales bacterium]|nr:NAD-dependent succinate-semialdehyde dehydrogenase [Bacteroidales bacterium]